MAPEQANGESEKITPATDIWALGLVTLRLLTGEHLWGSPSMPELIKNIVVAPIAKPSERWPSDKSVSPALDAWFARSCDRDPGKRWSSVEDQMRSLQDALAVDPSRWRIRARAGRSRWSARRWKSRRVVGRAPIRSRRWLSALVIGAFVCSAIAIGFHLHGDASHPNPVVAARQETAAVDASTLLLDDLPASSTTSGAAQLQRAYLSSIRAAGLDTPGREAFRAATEEREALSARDRAFLDALSPSFLDPPRYRDTADRMEVFIAAHPGDVEAEDALGFATISIADDARAERAFRAQLRLQPGAPVATKLLAQLLLGHAQMVEAIEVLEACIARMSSATGCRQQLTATLASTGRCSDADSAARDAVATDPADLDVASLRAATAAAAGAPPDAIAALLARRRTLAAVDARMGLEGDDADSMAMRERDFPIPRISSTSVHRFSGRWAKLVGAPTRRHRSYAAPRCEAFRSALWVTRQDAC